MGFTSGFWSVRGLGFRQYSGFLLPHEWEAQRVETARRFAQILWGVTLAVGLWLLATNRDPAPLVILTLGSCALSARFLWLKHRLEKFMRSSGMKWTDTT